MTKTKTKTKTEKSVCKGAAAKKAKGGKQSIPKTTEKAFDESAAHEYRAVISLGPGVEATEEFSMKPSKSEHLHIDDINDVVYDMMEEKYPLEYYPHADIKEIFIKDGDSYYPVVGESDEKMIEVLKKTTDKFLILPEIKYSLSPEFKLYLALQSKGLVGPDDTFDPNMYKEIIEQSK